MPVQPASSPPAPPAPRRARSLALVLALGLALTAAVGACSANSGSDDTAPSTAAADAPKLTVSGPASATDGLGAETGSSPSAATANGGAGGGSALGIAAEQLDPRSIIRTGSVALLADDPLGVRDQVADLVTDLGGYIADESQRTRTATEDPSEEAATGTVDEVQLLLQVPTARFEEAVDKIGAFGTETSRDTKAEDVTGQVADVGSRVTSARVALDRIRALLDRAQSLGTVIRLEGVLSRREADLEALTAQQRALAGQTALGTLRVDITAPAQAEPPATTPKDEHSGFLSGLGKGWDAMQAAYVGTSTVIGALLPFALVAVLVAVPVLAWRRRRVPVSAEPAAPPQ